MLSIQVYDVTNDNGEWWMARLIRDVDGGDSSKGQEGWVPRSFMDPFQGELDFEDHMFAIYAGKHGSIVPETTRARSNTNPVRVR